jgi:signal transduction histidine kinase
MGLRLPARVRSTARLRLTLLYSGLFLLMGTVVIVIIYALARAGTTVRVSPALPVRQVAIASGAAVRRYVIPGILTNQRNADLGRLLGVSWFVLAITALASTVLGWFAAGRVLAPLREMDLAARSISAGNLGRRLGLTGRDDEFTRLAGTFDELLSRLEGAFEAQRRFVANASHELRTPLTVDRAVLQVALSDPDASAETLRTACEEVLASGREQERLLEALLTLASTERGLEHPEPVELSALADKALAAVPARGVTVTRALGPARTTGEPALIERLIANLIDNAVQYNDARARVEVTTGNGGAGAQVTVTNTGPLIAAEHLPPLFEPFQRLGSRRGSDSHHGLGLSIVRAIASVHGATVDARPREEGGLAVTVRFPPAGA